MTSEIFEIMRRNNWKLKKRKQKYTYIEVTEVNTFCPGQNLGNWFPQDTCYLDTFFYYKNMFLTSMMWACFNF